MKYQAPRGMNDILPDAQKYWRFVEKVITQTVQARGFKRIDLPLVEYADLYARSTGEASDIVRKEMYYVSAGKSDKESGKLVLRPEGTPGVARAYIEYGMRVLAQPVMLYYFGPFFRHDRPQAGRLRQFWQFGLETIGSADPVVDAQNIELVWHIFKMLGLDDISIQINSIGDKNCRNNIKKVLLAYYKPHEKKLCLDCKERIKKNPFRLLDCKEKSCEFLISEAPQIIDYLDNHCRDHFKQVLEFLDELEVPYDLNPRLVRGLDYYTRTTFEVVPSDTEGSQGSLAAGGRYDELIKLLGGNATPAIGFAFGIERIIERLKKNGIEVSGDGKTDVLVACIGDLAKKKCVNLLSLLQKEGLSVASALGKGSIKAQLRLAQKLGASFTVIVGQREAFDNNVIVRDMVNHSQETVAIADLVDFIKKKNK